MSGSAYDSTPSSQTTFTITISCGMEITSRCGKERRIQSLTISFIVLSGVCFHEGRRLKGTTGLVSTVGLMIASHRLVSSLIRCDIHATDYRSDHGAIETMFNVKPPYRAVEPRLLFKNAPWKSIRDRAAEAHEKQPFYGSVQEQMD